jgi:hypothetical protein
MACKLAENEVPYFEHYRAVLAEELATQPYGVSEFWRRTVLRDASQDRFVLNAVIAISAMSWALKSRAAYELYDNSSISPTTRDAYYKHYSLALHHYSTVLASYRGLLASESITKIIPRKILIITLIITVFENLQGNRTSVDALTAKSILVLKNIIMQTDTQSQTATSQIAVAVDDEGVEEAEFYLARQGAVSSLLSPIYPLTKRSIMVFRQLDTLSPPDLSETLQTFNRVYLQFLTLNLLWFVRNIAIEPSGFPTGAKRILEREQIFWLSRLEPWLHATKARIDALRATKDKIHINRDWITLQLIEMGLKTVYAGNCSALDPSRGKMGAHRFVGEVVQQARQLLRIKFPTPAFQRHIYERISFMTINLMKECRDFELRSSLQILNKEILDAESSFEVKIALLGALALVKVEDTYRDENQYLSLDHYHDWTAAIWDEENAVLHVTLTARKPSFQVKRQTHLKLQPNEWGLRWGAS